MQSDSGFKHYEGLGAKATHPRGFGGGLQVLKSDEFEDRPDYMMLRKQFANLRVLFSVPGLQRKWCFTARERLVCGKALLQREEGNPIQAG